MSISGTCEKKIGGFMKITVASGNVVFAKRTIDKYKFDQVTMVSEGLRAEIVSGMKGMLGDTSAVAVRVQAS